MTTKSIVRAYPDHPGGGGYRCRVYSGTNLAGLAYEFGVSIRELAPLPGRSEQPSRIEARYDRAPGGSPAQRFQTQEPIARWESEGGAVG